VLLAGPFASAEIYSPDSDLFSVVGNMYAARIGHTATVFQEDPGYDETEYVLVAGGDVTTSTPTAEIFDPASHTFTPVAGGMVSYRTNHAAARLADGRVLVSGGSDLGGTRLQSAEIYDPVTGAFSAAAPMLGAREFHTLTTLADGRVLAVGGFPSQDSAEIYNPTTNAWSSTAEMPDEQRGGHTATRLPDGRVLVIGGQSGSVWTTAELFDPVTGQFSSVGSMAAPRFSHTATLLPDDPETEPIEVQVLVAGGWSELPVSHYVLPLGTMEVFDLSAGGFRSAGTLAARRAQSFAGLLPDRRVIVAGGFTQGWLTTNAAEIIDVFDPPRLLTDDLPEGHVGAAYPETTLEGDGGSGGPYTIEIVSGQLPPGMSYTQATRTLSGTPTAGGFYTVGVRVTDGADTSADHSLVIGIGTFEITSGPSLPIGLLGHDYEVQLLSTGLAPVTWTVIGGTLPTGVSVDSSGLVSGETLSPDFHNFMVRATDATGLSVLKALSIFVVDP
jgi:hypothetical protein